jgi:deazaflavin-dependent oxidoreductase (nitroreductase family)
MRLVSRLNTWVYRASGGRIGGRIPGGGPVGLLGMTGRRSGRRLTLPLVYARDGARVVLVASQGGMPRHPIWYRNLEAHPDVEFQIGRERRAYRARTARGEEREAAWKLACAVYPDFAEYQKRTQREIPVVVLDPR